MAYQPCCPELRNEPKQAQPLSMQLLTDSTGSLSAALGENQGLDFRSLSMSLQQPETFVIFYEQ